MQYLIHKEAWIVFGSKEKITFKLTDHKNHQLYQNEYVVKPSLACYYKHVELSYRWSTFWLGSQQFDSFL